jgi:hypothetical protein
MGFINTVSEAFKDALKPKLNWKGTAGSVSHLFSKERKPAVVATSIDDVEFMNRYKNVRLSAISSMAFFTFSFLSIPFVNSWTGFITSLLGVILFSLFYFRYAFILWVCRKSWILSIDLEQPVNYTVGSFFKAIGEDAAEFLPQKLPQKKGEKK